MRFALCIFTFLSAVSVIHGWLGGLFRDWYEGPNEDRHEGWQKRSPLVTEYEWKYFDYVWDMQHQKNDYISRGLYDYKNMTPIDVDRSSDGRTFVTIIRTNGVPATLHTVSNRRGESGPLLKPYPDWSWYESLQCDNIINVYRVAIDECNRMWVLDTGVIDDKYPCPAKLLVFDLKSDRLLFTHVIPDDVARNTSGSGLLITPIVETYGPRCTETTVYMADCFGHGLVIYNNRRTYRLEADEFAPERQNSDFTIAGESFFLDDGLFGMALTPLSHHHHKRYLMFRSLASKSLYGASTETLERSTNGGMIDDLRGIDVLPSQASAMAFSSEGTLFYGLCSETAIGCWNFDRPLESKYFKVAIQDSVRLQFTSGLKVIKNSYQRENEYLLMMTNRLQKIYDGTMDFDEINFRISRASVRDVISGTICDRY